jgi:DNA processing protein
VRLVGRRDGLWAEGLAHRVVARGDDEYPTLLEHLADPPERLWVAGRSLARLHPAVAVVGTRTPTLYGLEVARALAADLARAGVTVVSGLARGVDAAAHEGALERGATVAVLPGGIDRVYPASNRDLYARILEQGALVAELPPGAPAHRHRFTVRNRIIAGLALAVVVVQAGERSGALSTARHAMDIGRDVLAVPGDVRVEVSAGPHELLRDGAFLCAGAGDVLERIGVEMRRADGGRTLGPIPDDLPPDDRSVLEVLGGEVLGAEAVGRATGLAGAALSRTLARLELGGWIHRAPGGGFRRVR